MYRSMNKMLFLHIQLVDIHVVGFIITESECDNRWSPQFSSQSCCIAVTNHIIQCKLLLD